MTLFISVVHTWLRFPFVHVDVSVVIYLHFAFSGASYIAMLRYLHPENAMLLFYLVLTEHKILIHSLRPTLLTSIAEAITMVCYNIIIHNIILLLVRLAFLYLTSRL